MRKLLIMILLFFMPQFIYASILNDVEPFVEFDGINEDDYYISKTIDKNLVIVKIKEKKTNYEYSWSFDKNKINDKIKLNFNIDFESEKKDEIDSIAGNITKKYLSFSHHGSLPTSASIKVDVSDKFKDGNKLYLYYYNEDIKKIEFIEKDIIVTDGYAEFSIDHCSQYFLTDAIVNNAENNPKSLNKVIFALTFIVIGLMAYTIFKKQ